MIRSMRVCIGVASALAALNVTLLLCIITGRDFATTMGFPLNWPVIVLIVGVGIMGGLLPGGHYERML